MNTLEEKLNELEETVVHEGKEYSLFISRTSGLWGSVVGWDVAYALGTYYCDEECTEGYDMLLHSCGAKTLESATESMLDFLRGIES